MARFSTTAGHVKLETGDIVFVEKVDGNTVELKGKVLEVNVMRPDMISVEGIQISPRVDVLVTVDFTRDKGMPTVLCFEEITAVRGKSKWFSMKGEEIAITA